MVEILAFSQSSLLLSSRPSSLLCSPRRAHLINCSRASLTITSPARFSPTKPITFSTSQTEQISTTARVVSDSKVPTTFTVDSAGGGYDILPELGGSGDNPGGMGGDDGGGGGGGGGGGENGKNEDEGGPEEEKPGMSMSQKLTLGYAALVGIGGLIGYLKSGSTKSLISGGASAAILYFVYTLLPFNPVLASCVGGVLSATLLGVMGLRFKKSGKVFPAGVVALMSLVMSGGYAHGILRSLH